MQDGAFAVQQKKADPQRCNLGKLTEIPGTGNHRREKFKARGDLKIQFRYGIVKAAQDFHGKEYTALWNGGIFLIRLIASDMDGSLLDENKQIPKEFYDIFPLLRQQGISFVVASGRSYCTLTRNFGPVANQIHYICDNGAFVVYNDRVTVTPIPQAQLKELVAVCDALPGIQVLLCGRGGTYHKSYTDGFNAEINSYYVNQTLVPDLTQVRDEIFKIAICDTRGPQNGVSPILRERFGDSLSMQISGQIWMDVMSRGVNKGAALKKIQETGRFSYEETMAFGDYYNDIELLKRAYYSFAMENGAADMKRHARFVARKNSEAGVVRAILAYALQRPDERHTGFVRKL